MIKFRKVLAKFGQAGELWLYRRNVVGTHGKVKLVDLREESPWFRVCITRALDLIERVDRRRYSRIQENIEWIVNAYVYGKGAQYKHYNMRCDIEFAEPSEKYEEGAFRFDVLSGYYASVIVHESTHGKIRRLRSDADRGMKERLREERICISEEKKFLEKLYQYDEAFTEIKFPVFVEDFYKKTYKLSNLQREGSVIKRATIEMIRNYIQPVAGGDATRWRS